MDKSFIFVWLPYIIWWMSLVCLCVCVFIRHLTFFSIYTNFWFQMFSISIHFFLFIHRINHYKVIIIIMENFFFFACFLFCLWKQTRGQRKGERERENFETFGHNRRTKQKKKITWSKHKFQGFICTLVQCSVGDIYRPKKSLLI